MLQGTNILDFGSFRIANGRIIYDVFQLIESCRLPPAGDTSRESPDISAYPHLGSINLPHSAANLNSAFKAPLARPAFVMIDRFDFFRSHEIPRGPRALALKKYINIVHVVEKDHHGGDRAPPLLLRTMSILGIKAVLLVTIVFPSIGRAQQSSIAKCNPAAGYDWAFNSKNQSPCDVASFLGGACLNGILFGVPPLNATQIYQGPTLANANQCRCNTVFYSLLSACAGCQGARYLTWTSYSTNCSSSEENAPVIIPFGTAVPSWAYINVNPNGFDPVAARESANGPESTGTPQPTGTNTQSLTPGSSSTRLSSESGGGGGSSNAGAIAGGVIGGIVGVSVIAGLTFWFIRRRRRNSRLHDTWSVDPSLDVNAGNTSPSPTMTADTTRKYYDPSDPSTFPDAPGMQPYVPGQTVSFQTLGSGSQGGSGTVQHEHHRSLSGGPSTHPGSPGTNSTPSHRRNYSGSGSYTGTPEV
ncbi:hypothetical protein L218DRAFT_959949 [Marasmius fiardii PR-910]|nr:hypothetical protein L218DRAFT_959949 [Marasmius fiardii PR-910]